MVDDKQYAPKDLRPQMILSLALWQGTLALEKIATVSVLEVGIQVSCSCASCH
jgi:hypothetical protein